MPLLRPILVVDDEPANLALMQSILSADYKLVFATNGRDALAAALKHKPSMILLDVQLPDISGYEVCRQVLAHPASSDCVVIFVTSMSASHDEEYGFQLGAVDYIVKPISAPLVRARVKAHLAMVRLDRLEQSYKEAISMLGEAAHFNDEGTGVHIWRMASYSSALARAAGQDESFCKQLELAASMHDTGKIGIPHKILKKPDKLDDDEWAIMKTHSQLGYDILSRGSSSLFEMAATIALAHHERWDGSGYPLGLRRETIPLEARIVAIADVFDALTMPRPYKVAWPVDKAIDYIRESSGSHFDPWLCKVFVDIVPTIKQLQAHWDEEESQRAHPLA